VEISIYADIAEENTVVGKNFKTKVEEEENGT
jgi:hypothetical protein